MATLKSIKNNNNNSGMKKILSALIFTFLFARSLQGELIHRVIIHERMPLYTYSDYYNAEQQMRNRINNDIYQTVRKYFDESFPRMIHASSWSGDIQEFCKVTLHHLEHKELSLHNTRLLSRQALTIISRALSSIYELTNDPFAQELNKYIYTNQEPSNVVVLSREQRVVLDTIRTLKRYIAQANTAEKTQAVIGVMALVGLVVGCVLCRFNFPVLYTRTYSPLFFRNYEIRTTHVYI